MIEQLRNSKDPLIEKFSDQEIYPLTVDNRYHSPEESETDEDSNTEKRRIVIKDLQWRSSTVSKHLLKLFYSNTDRRCFLDTNVFKRIFGQII